MNKSLKLFGIVAILNAGFLLISNLIATKIWSFCGLPFDAGVILFPLIYILGDVTNEIFGTKPSTWIAWTGLMLSTIAIFAFKIAVKLPSYPGWGGQEAFEYVFNMAPRVLAASLVAYIISTLVDISVFDKIKRSQNGSERQFYARALGSSAVSRLIDSLIFETIAFYGILSTREFVIQAILAYAAAMFLETALFPISSLCVRFMRRFLSGKSANAYDEKH